MTNPEAKEVQDSNGTVPSDMATDSMTTLSLAGASISFLNIGHRIVGEGYDNHNSDNDLPMKLEPEEVISNISMLKSKLELEGWIRTMIGCLTKIEQEIENLCRACGIVANDLLIRMEKIKAAQSRARDGGALQSALQNAWPKEDIDALRGRLTEFRAELELHIIRRLRHFLKLKRFVASQRLAFLHGSG